jgi:hypothetical protein
MDCAFRLGGTVLLWESRKQRTVVALSSTEAQYMAFTHSTKTIFLQNMFCELLGKKDSTAL